MQVRDFIFLGFGLTVGAWLTSIYSNSSIDKKTLGLTPTEQMVKAPLGRPPETKPKQTIKTVRSRITPNNVDCPTEIVDEKLELAFRPPNPPSKKTLVDETIENTKLISKITDSDWSFADEKKLTSKTQNADGSTSENYKLPGGRELTLDFDKDGNLSSEFMIMQGDEIENGYEISETVQRSYDSNGKMTGVNYWKGDKGFDIEWNEYGSVKSRTDFIKDFEFRKKYDDYGNEIEAKLFSPDESFSENNSFENERELSL